METAQQSNETAEKTLFPDEADHLAMIRDKLVDAIERANESVEQTDREYMAVKRYMAQYCGEIDPHEMFQNELSLRQMDKWGVFAVDSRDKLVKLLDSPYFARVDFREAASPNPPAAFYIGRFAFTADGRVLISDWRSPVAGMFYDCEIGPAGYDAPARRITGELTRKRQFKIKGGTLEYVLETSVAIDDAVLQRELSRTADEKMKSIIATIQKEQNRLIRNEQAGTLLIQGVAGSGKTSVALHRVAYLLYRHRGRLLAKNVAILSPSKVFADYISQVLPELGEEPVGVGSFADIAAEQLDGIIRFESEPDPLETAETKWADRVRFKSTLEFKEQMDAYLERMPETIFAPADYTYDRFIATSEWIGSRFAAYRRHPVKRRLQLLAEDIRNRFETENFLGDSLPTSRSILKSLLTRLTIKNTLSLYKDFYKQMNSADKFVMPAKNTLEWADVYPFIYFLAAFEGIREHPLIQHLVIDEMQDYTPTQHAVITLLFSCRKTILGDFGQSIHIRHRHTLNDLRQIYKEAECVELNKSYRSTYEIITFAGRILKAASIEAVERHGEAPELLCCRDGQAEIDQIEQEIEKFGNSGHGTLGIIVKTNAAAQTLFDVLASKQNVNLILPASATFSEGVSIASIQMAKGLEFDRVIIPAANHETYSSEHDRSLLYIACTRAMHRLTLTYTGEITRLLGA